MAKTSKAKDAFLVKNLDDGTYLKKRSPHAWCWTPKKSRALRLTAAYASRLAHEYATTIGGAVDVVPATVPTRSK